MNLKDNRDSNRNYYQHMYGQIHATDELKERLIQMNTTRQNHKKPPRRMTWKAAAAVAALCVTLPSGAYAANHYFGITEFFSASGHALDEEANKLIETNIPQTSEKSPAQDRPQNHNPKNDPIPNTDSATSGSETPDSIPVSFTVQEALCDSGSVHIIVTAKASETGTYLLVPDDLTEETDSVENIGIHEDLSIRDYAKANGLEILYVGTGFQADSPFSPAVCSFSSKSETDGTLSTIVSADRTESDTDLHAILTHTVRPANTENAAHNMWRTSTAFTLDDKSTSKLRTYRPKDSTVIPGTQAHVQKVLMEQTEVATYVTVYYTNPQKTEDDGLYFGILDANGKEWALKGGRGIEQKKDGSYCLYLTYNRTELPRSFELKAFDYLEKNTFGKLTLMAE